MSFASIFGAAASGSISLAALAYMVKVALTQQRLRDSLSAVKRYCAAMVLGSASTSTLLLFISEEDGWELLAIVGGSYVAATVAFSAVMIRTTKKRLARS